MEYMFKEYKTPLNSFIGAWFIDEKICDEMIQYFKENKKSAKKGTVSHDVTNSYIKDSLDLSLNKSNKLLKKYWSENFQKLIHLYEKKYEFVSKLEKYNLVVEHLIQEGYAQDQESADHIITGMSEEWYTMIVNR